MVQKVLDVRREGFFQILGTLWLALALSALSEVFLVPAKMVC